MPREKPKSHKKGTSHSITKKVQLFQIIGIVIFVFIISKMDLSNIIRIWHDISIHFMLLAASTVIALHILHAVKWKYILQCLSISVSLSESVMIFWVGAFIGMVTPGKIGDLLKIYFLGDVNHSRIRILLSVVFDRVTDILFLVIIATISAFAVFEWRVSLYQCGLLFILMGIILLIIIQFKKKFFLHFKESYLYMFLCFFNKSRSLVLYA